MTQSEDLLDEAVEACNTFNAGKGVTYYKQDSPEYTKREGVRKARARALAAAIEAGITVEEVANAVGLKVSTIRVIVKEQAQEDSRDEANQMRRAMTIIRHLVRPGTKVSIIPSDGSKALSVSTAEVGEGYIVFNDGTSLIIETPFQIPKDAAVVEFSGERWSRLDPNDNVWISKYRNHKTTENLIQWALDYNDPPVVRARYESSQ